MKNLFILITAILATMMIPSLAFAQGKGNMRGTIKDKEGNTLPGASISISGTTVGVASNMNGEYVLQGISAGDVDINVNYLGYKAISKKVKIEAGKTVIQDFVMEDNAIAFGEVEVSAVVGGQQRALNQQKMADNLMQVISADQMGKFPDPNVADALKRLSGVTSDGKEIQLRGTPASFTSINVNGEQIMSSQEGGKRNESLDVIPSDLLASMEVQKTLLPSNDGDAIAGVINMRTGTARTLTPRFSVDMGSGYAFLREKVNYNAKGSYSQRFFANGRNPNGVLGIAANYSFQRIHNGYDRLEAEAWEPYKLTDYKTGEVVSESEYIPTDFRYRQQSRKSTRNGAALVIDWAPTINTKFVLSTVYNNREDDDERYRNRTRFRNNSNGFFLMEDGSIGGQRMQNITQVSTQNEKIKNLNINLDGESTIGTWKVDGGLFYTNSKRNYVSEMFGLQTPEWRTGKKVNGVTIPSDAIVGVIPDIHAKVLTSSYLFQPFGNMGAEAPNAISRYSIYTVENNNQITRGNNFTARANVSKNYFIGDYASTLSFGVKGKFMHNKGEVPEGTETFSVTPSEANNLTNMLYTDQLNSKFLNNKVPFGIAPNLGAAKAYMNNPANAGTISVNEYFTRMNIDGSYYEANEDVYAGYIMNKVQIDKTMLLFGGRVEHTRVGYKANVISPFYDPNAPTYNTSNPDTDFNNYTIEPVKATLNYTKFLPNIQMKSDMSENTVLRLAWTTGYSRPNVLDLVPKQGVSQSEQRIHIGNPQLKPAYANNFDILIEQYLSSVGVVSLGAFHKNIAKFQYIHEGTLDDSNSAYNGWQLIQPQNGENAKVFGAELTLNASLTFLPWYFKNLVFSSNYTYVFSQATADENRGVTRLPGQAENTGNAALAYSTKRFTLQASLNYMGSYITALGSNTQRDIWQDDRWQLDLNGSVNIYKGLSFWLEVTNVTNSEYYTYFGDKSRVYTLQYSGATGRGGFTYKF